MPEVQGLPPTKGVVTGRYVIGMAVADMGLDFLAINDRSNTEENSAMKFY